MPDLKYTPEGLPVVSPETILSFLYKDFKKLHPKTREVREIEEGLTKMLNSIQEGNPELTRMMLESMSLLEINKETRLYRTGLIHGAYLIYELLRRQAEANKMSQR